MPIPTSKYNAFVKCKCPQCRRGDVFMGSLYTFKGNNPYDICSNCSLKFEIEPGYFYAAMYVSYAMNVAEMLGMSLITFLCIGALSDNNFWIYIVTIFSTCFILYPFNYRYSRIILLHWLSPKISYNIKLDK